MLISERAQLRIDAAPVIRVAGELDMSNARDLEDALERPSARPDAIVCLDLAEVTFIDTTGLHAIADAAARVPDGSVIVLNAAPAIRRVFELVGLDRCSNVHMV